MYRRPPISTLADTHFPYTTLPRSGALPMLDTPGPAVGPKCHRPGSYGETHAFSRRAWAWEFLRRNRAYLQAWSDAAAHAVIETPAPGLVVVTAGAELAGLSRCGVFFQRCS